MVVLELLRLQKSAMQRDDRGVLGGDALLADVPPCALDGDIAHGVARADVPHGVLFGNVLGASNLCPHIPVGRTPAGRRPGC